MYRNKEERRLQMCLAGGDSKDTWLRSYCATSTLTVPATPNGLLAELVRKNLKECWRPAGTLTKVIEIGGISSPMNLVKSNQFTKERCHRLDCLLCFQKLWKQVSEEQYWIQGSMSNIYIIYSRD